ncbi:inositol oxygenase-like [Dysidea avara]|uniref:inositol oxygenase-like n=1 Tax=Dysidea avara TaxID=196820 RepID=UPI003333B233
MKLLTSAKNIILSTDSPVYCPDPSEYRPELLDSTVGKDKEQFRTFDVQDGEDLTDEQIRKNAEVKETYRKMHTFQTVDFVRQKLSYWGKMDKVQMTLMDAILMLDNLVDESDPDIDLPNSVHAFQTAERIREAYPGQEYDWFHLTGLIHDAGKVLALWGEPQWAVVGDTNPVGCQFSNTIVFPKLFKQSLDYSNPLYNTKYGMYSPNCGLRNILMSFGHDEYLYRVLTSNNCKLPEEALYMIRYHSFYPWHTHGSYQYLCDDTDKKMLPWVQSFNKFDLYSKADHLPDRDALMPYYQGLINKYIPGEICW